jgi:predicted dehydrogenase
VKPTVALVGAAGHGAWHLRTIGGLHQSGRLRMVSVCDIRPLGDQARATLPPGVRVFSQHLAMLQALRPDVVVVATPPHTHLQIAADVLRAGSDLLLEKPPLVDLAGHHRLAALLRASGRSCQVNFQSLASPALIELERAIARGRLGRLSGIAVAGTWLRDDSYWRRAAWVGRRQLGGSPVADGALSNPFAHAVMNALVLAAAAGHSQPERVELELYRARDIEVDDTACLRATFPGGLRVVVAVTLCAPRHLPPLITVHGSAGSAILEYTEDRLRLPADAAPRPVPGRVGMLEGLLDHRDDPERAPLLAPLERTEPFTRLVEIVRRSPAPHPIEQRFLEVRGHGATRRVLVAGVSEAVRAAADGLALFSEIGVAWARPGVAWRLEGGSLLAAEEEPCGS